MLRILFSLLLLGASAMGAFACTMDPEERAQSLSGYLKQGQACLANPPGAFRFDAEMEAGFLTAINHERRTRGLTELKLRESLIPAARFHSLDMGVNAFMSHETVNGRTHADRIAAHDRTLLTRSTAENLAQFGPALCYNHDKALVSCTGLPGFERPDADFVLNDLHTKLMASEGHRVNILDPKNTHIGIGVARTETGFNVTQVFAEWAGEFSAPVPLEMVAGEALDLEATVPDWTVTNLAVSQANQSHDFVEGRVPSGVTGTAVLNARAELSAIEKRGSSMVKHVTHVYLTGPLVDVLPAKGS